MTDSCQNHVFSRVVKIMIVLLLKSFAARTESTSCTCRKNQEKIVFLKSYDNCVKFKHYLIVFWIELGNYVLIFIFKLCFEFFWFLILEHSIPSWLVNHGGERRQHPKLKNNLGVHRDWCISVEKQYVLAMNFLYVLEFIWTSIKINE